MVYSKEKCNKKRNVIDSTLRTHPHGSIVRYSKFLIKSSEIPEHFNYRLKIFKSMLNEDNNPYANKWIGC